MVTHKKKVNAVSFIAIYFCKALLWGPKNYDFIWISYMHNPLHRHNFGTNNELVWDTILYKKEHSSSKHLGMEMLKIVLVTGGISNENTTLFV